MKIIVDKLPNKPEDCVFYKREYSNAPYSNELQFRYCCAIDGYRCNCKKCYKLKEFDK